MVKQPLTERSEKRRLRHVIQAMTYLNRYTNEVFYQLELREITEDLWTELVDTIEWSIRTLYKNNVIENQTHNKLRKGLNKIRKGNEISNMDLVEQGIEEIYDLYDKEVVDSITNFLFNIEFKEKPFNVPDFTIRDGTLLVFHIDRGWEEPSKELLHKDFVEAYIRQYYGDDVYREALQNAWTEGFRFDYTRYI